MLGVLWIVFSDISIARIFTDPRSLSLAQTWKGSIYVLFTAALLYVLVRAALRRQIELDRRNLEIKRQYLDLASMAPVGLFSADEPGVALYINDAGADLIGLPAGQCLGTGWQAAVHEEDRDRVRSAWSAALEAGRSLAEEFRWRHADGTVVWVVGTANPQYDGDGRIVRFIATLTDITERKAAEARARETEVRYRQLFESNPIPMCVWDPETLKFLAVNEAMIAHYGYSRDEFLDMTVADIRPAEDVPRLVGTLAEARRGAYDAGTWRHIRKNGEMIDVAVRSHPVGSGDHAAMLAQITDVTQQRRAEAALEQERLTLRETTQRLNHILTTSPTLVFSTLIKGRKVTPIWISDNVERILGYTREEALDPDWWPRHIHPDDLERSTESVLCGFRARDSVVDEFRFFSKAGNTVWFRLEARRVSGDPESGLEIVGTWSDITEEHQAGERLRLDAAAFESTRDGVMITDLDSRIISVNRALLEVTGYAEEELLGRYPSLFRSGRHEPGFYQSMWTSLADTGFWQGEIWNRSRAGEIFPVWLSISAVRNDAGALTHYVAIYTDITQLKQSEKELHTLAHFDPLTSLPNRLLLQSRLEHAIDQAGRHKRTLAVIFLDLDDFKKVNDSLGHSVGDELLAQVADRLRARVRDEDTLARQGGDEFVVLLESLQEPMDAAVVARDLLACLAAPFKLSSKQELHVHGSIGISVFPDDGRTPAELLQAADTAMYRAKDEGGNRPLFFTPEMSSEVVASLEIENALRQALARNEFTLHFQPKIHLASGEIRSAEALLRWESGDIGFVPPNEFIPVAERTGLIEPIGNWVIDSACAQYAAWCEAGLPPITIGVNVSARQFHSPGLEQTVLSALEKHRVPAERLVLELTESMLMQRPEEAAATLERLNRIGVGSALDDFGTGFSSLAYLTRFPVDTLKVDGSFVRGIETDPSARKIITAIVDLAHGLGMHTVAEGVETEEQEAFVRKLGCTSLQGYRLSKPLPPAGFTAFLRSWPESASRWAG